MQIKSATSLAHYELVSAIGKGGMGEVWKAVDTRLGRGVAIKRLPESLSLDRERLSRLEREAKLLASINHANISIIHGLEEHDGERFLVLELVDGVTLEKRLRQGPIPIDESLQIGLQITRALEAAHEKGVIHRDLKPANVMITSDGTVKVLDFGIAKALAGDDVSDEGTRVQDGQSVSTASGRLLGTPAYMSPEQARGEPVDARADVWAFGCVLFEMLSGQPVFAAPTAADTLANVLMAEPAWSALPEGLHLRIRWLLEGCLERNGKDRCRDIGHARVEIGKALAEPAVEVAVAPRRSSTLPIATGVSMLAIGLIGLAVGWYLRPADTRPVSRLVVPLELNATQVDLWPALSPNGRYLAYTWGSTGQQQLSLVRTADPEGEPIAEFALGIGGFPFFSPDSEWLGFFAQGKLQKVSVRGGPPIELADTPGPRGASWSDDGRIIFAPLSRGGLYEIPENGGAETLLLSPDAELGETSYRGPFILPGSGAILYSAIGASNDDVAVAVYSLQTAERKLLADGGTGARYLVSGHIVYNAANTIMAARFDTDTLSVVGTPVPVLEDAGPLGVSDAGLLVYQSGSEALPRLSLVNRTGSSEPVDDERKGFQQPRLSPDSRRLVVVDNFAAIWLHDIASGTWQRLTFQDRVGWPLWSAEGDRVIYSVNSPGTTWDLYSQPADGAGAAEPLLVADGDQYAQGTISRDGKILAYGARDDSATGVDIWLLEIDGGAPRLLNKEPGQQGSGALSPDARFVAYSSDESGRFEIYVRSLTDPGKRQISYDGGSEPLWSPTGEIFYRSPTHMVAVPVATEPELVIGSATLLFEDRYVRSNVLTRDYDVSADGQRFLMIEPGEPEESTLRLNAVVNWFEELEALVPAE